MMLPIFSSRVPVKYSIVDSEDQESTTKSTTQLRRGSQQQRGYKKNTNNTTSRKQLHDLKRDNQEKMNRGVGIDASMLLQRIHPTLSNTQTPVSPSDCNFANSMSNGFNSLQPRSPLPPLMVRCLFFYFSYVFGWEADHETHIAS